MNADDIRRLIRHAATLADIQKDLMRMVADHMGDALAVELRPDPELSDGPRRTRRMGGNS